MSGSPLYDAMLSRRAYAPLGSIHLPIASLITGEDLQTDQVRDKDLFFMTEPRRVSVDTGKLPPVPSRCNLKATTVPVGPINRRTRRTEGRLTGGSSVDMKDKSHNISAFSSKRSVVCHPLIPHLGSEIHVVCMELSLSRFHHWLSRN
jgi:hypothetical protein